ncbi:hypothetical protein LRS05_06445 [Flavobacterium sp. J372]|uniref:hypothetical protein n=1 Tax=Flavobacterium sp. J372 TaxID=2898436 RepID=UPI00215159A7|nr:hypothetical protein [Flavobacterium sp. J372]MCR5861798.1 hypothetical protein [Flavobacterium sp. J372]
MKFLILFSLAAISSNAQCVLTIDEPNKNIIPDSITIYNPNDVDRLPIVTSGIDNFREEFISKLHKQYKLNKNTPHRLYTSFVIERNGTISGVKIGHYGNKSEIVIIAERIIQSIKAKWIPGFIKNYPVRTLYSLPILIRHN